MSPASETIERLAKARGVPVLEAMEFFLERAAIREFEGGMSRSEAELAALSDLELWVKLWIQLKGEPGPQLVLKAVPQ
jgi:hypothetical protein